MNGWKGEWRRLEVAFCLLPGTVFCGLLLVLQLIFFLGVLFERILSAAGAAGIGQMLGQFVSGLAYVFALSLVSFVSGDPGVGIEFFSRSLVATGNLTAMLLGVVAAWYSVFTTGSWSSDIAHRVKWLVMVGLSFGCLAAIQWLLIMRWWLALTNPRGWLLIYLLVAPLIVGARHRGRE